MRWPIYGTTLKPVPGNDLAVELVREQPRKTLLLIAANDTELMKWLNEILRQKVLTDNFIGQLNIDVSEPEQAPETPGVKAKVTDAARIVSDTVSDGGAYSSHPSAAMQYCSLRCGCMHCATLFVRLFLLLTQHCFAIQQ